MGEARCHRSVVAPPAGKRVLLAEPRGYCAGVDRAVETVERALEKHGPRCTSATRSCTTATSSRPWPRRARSSSRRPTRCPRARSSCSPPTASRRRCTSTAAERNLTVIDATCPLVTKVHNEAKRFARDDYDILLIGHEGHEEVVGTAGEAPDHVQLVDGPELGRLGDRARREQGHLAVADHAQRRRDHGDRAAAARALPEAAGSAQRRHLLRHAEPPGRGQGDGAGVRAGDRGRVAQLVELGAAGRGGARRRLERPRTSSTTPRTSIRPGWTASRRSASPPARRCPRCWSAACSNGWPSTATARCSP